MGFTSATRFSFNNYMCIRGQLKCSFLILKFFLLPCPLHFFLGLDSLSAPAHAPPSAPAVSLATAPSPSPALAVTWCIRMKDYVKSMSFFWTFIH